MKPFLLCLSVAVFILGSILNAQEARVLSLDRKDSDVAREAWENLQHAQKTWAHVQELIRGKYTVVPEGDKDASNMVIASSFAEKSYSIMCADQIISVTTTIQASKEDLAKCHAQQEKERKKAPTAMTYRLGWENGFQFSSDFKYIVPNVPKPEYRSPYTINPAPQWITTPVNQ